MAGARPDVRILLGKPAVEPLPGGAGIARPPDGRCPVRHAAAMPWVERDDVEALAVMRVRGGHEAAVGRQAVRHLGPGPPAVVASVHAAVVLLVEAVVVG